MYSYAKPIAAARTDKEFGSQFLAAFSCLKCLVTTPVRRRVRKLDSSKLVQCSELPPVLKYPLFPYSDTIICNRSASGNENQKLENETNYQLCTRSILKHLRSLATGSLEPLTVFVQAIIRVTIAKYLLPYCLYYSNWPKWYLRSYNNLSMYGEYIVLRVRFCLCLRCQQF